MNTMRTLLLAALCCVCLALPFPRLQRKRRDTGDKGPGPEPPAQNNSIEEFTTNSPEPPAQNNSIEEFTTNSTQEKQSWFDKVYEANNETVIVEGYVIRNLDIAYRIYKSDIIKLTHVSQCLHNVCLWPKSSDGFVYIPYSLSSDFASYGRMVIASSLGVLEDATCIRFRPQTSETDYINFQPTEGCWSSLGITGGAQIISLDLSCLWSGTVIHEVLHALGLNHEHVRYDRDSYVQVQWNNIQSSAKSNFDITDTYNLNLTDYDYESVMHYTNLAFSVNGQPTLIPISNKAIELGNYFSMSNLDIMKINTLYKCDAATLKNIMKRTSSSITTTTTTPATTTTTTTPATTTTTTKRTPSTTTRTPTTTTTKRTPSTTTRTPTTTTTKRTPSTTTRTPTTTTTKRTPSTTTRTPTTTTTKRTPSTTTRTPTTTTTKRTPSTTSTTTRTSTTTTASTTRTTTTKSTTTTAPKTILNGCGGNLTAPGGVFTSPNYPNDYPNNAYCHWNITTNTKFIVTFTDFDIESETYNCLFDKLMIYNGRGFDAMYRLKDLCGKNLPSPIISYGNSMQFVFISDPFVAYKGFRVVYSPI